MLTGLRSRALLIGLVAYAGLAGLQVGVGPWPLHLGAFLLLYALAWVAALDAWRSKLTWPALLVGAIVFRALLVPLTPSLSADIDRYVWEGRVQHAGYNPYVVPPDAPQLEPLRDDVWRGVNYPEATAIYPPAAQLAFRALAALGGGVMAFKLAFCLADLATILVLGLALQRAGRPLAPLALYAWNPLAIIEIAGSGHLEPLGLLPLVAGVLWVRRRPGRAWVAITGSILVKYASVVVVPFLIQTAPPRPRHLLGALAVAAGAGALYAGAGVHLFDSLRMYAERWRYNDLLFSIVQSCVPTARGARQVAAVLLGLTCGGLLFWKASFESKVVAAFGAALALSPTVHPWYLLWPLVLLPLRPSWVLFVWSGTVSLSYLFLFPAFGMGPLDKGSWGLKVLEMAPVAVCAALTWARSAGKRVHACNTASS